MHEGRARRLPRMKLLLSPLFAALGAAAAAQEYCVVCSEPSALYRCVIDGAQPQGGQPLQMLCVTAMAKAGGHGTCTVKRGTVFDCDGPVKRVPWAASNASAPKPQPQPSPPAAPAVTVKLARRVIQHLSHDEVAASMEDELFFQTFINRSDDFAEFKAARAEGRDPRYRGS